MCRPLLQILLCANDDQACWTLPARAIPLAIAVVLIGYVAQATYFTLQLSPPNEESNRPTICSLDSIRLTDNYMGGAESSYSKMSMVIGIKSEEIDRSMYNQYYPDINRGKVIYDDAFDIYPKANQDALVELCDTISKQVCTDVDDDSIKLKGCSNSGNTLVRAGTMQVSTIPCSLLPLLVCISI